MYVRDFVVARRRKRKDAEHYVVDVALISRAIADTGAGPSVVTDGLLDDMPADACVSRDYTPLDFPLVGPDGNDLVSRGRATIIFDLHGTPCRHTFLVVEGDPLVILGNDFLLTYQSVIRLDGPSHDGTLEFTTVKDGELRQHVAPVSTNPRPIAKTIYNITPHGLAAHPLSSLEQETPPLVDADTGRELQWEVEPLPKCEIPIDPSTQLPSTQLRHQTSTHLLYASAPVVLPPRSKVKI